MTKRKDRRHRRACKDCGRPFAVDHGGRFCSEGCAHAYARAMEVAKRRRFRDEKRNNKRMGE
jgi:transposase-like protein